MAGSFDDDDRVIGGQKETRPNMPRHRSKYTLWAIASTILILGLVLGLGLGFALRHGGGSPSKGSPPRPPTPTAVWQPKVGVQWQIVLNQVLDIDDESPAVVPDVEVFDIDMYLHQNSTVVANLHKLGKKVICYFSAGTFEKDRPDSYLFQKEDLGKNLTDNEWSSERWLNLSSPSVRDIMASRIDIASQMGCDAIDPDNLDGYQNDNGLSLTSDDSVEFLDFLVDKASALNLAVGLKNAPDIISDALPRVQFAVNEQCAQTDNCGPFRSFIKAGKPVFHIEYPASAPSSVSAADSGDACTSPGSNDFSTVMKVLKLDGWVQYCNGAKANTKVFS